MYYQPNVFSKEYSKYIKPSSCLNFLYNCPNVEFEETNSPFTVKKIASSGFTFKYRILIVFVFYHNYFSLLHQIK